MTNRGGFLHKLDPRRYIEFSSPVTLGLALASLLVLVLHRLTGGAATRALFAVYRSPLTDPLFYPRLFLHVLGHSNFAHYAANMGLLLVLGPPMEKRYGSRAFLLFVALTALVTGVFHLLLTPHGMALGASGVVFMLILLSAASGRETGKLPLTLLLVAAIYLGREIADGLFRKDGVSQLIHVIGGLCGALIGLLHGKRRL